ncbi:hypothetical protein Scep_022194 [Stephania cephalantha]|uniref:Retrotransposon gag domain-containing protein n=1 Tax=Stephania cephalantha TaxID=152367 RepID=A0AAP0F7H3_9MAGN
MRQLMRARFLPAYYEHLLYRQYHQCSQGTRSVAVCTEQFYRLNTRNNLQESQTQQVSRYIGGLKESIQDQLTLHRVYHQFEANSLALQVEAQLSRPAIKTSFYKRPPFEHHAQSSVANPSSNPPPLSGASKGKRSEVSSPMEQTRAGPPQHTNP